MRRVAGMEGTLLWVPSIMLACLLASTLPSIVASPEALNVPSWASRTPYLPIEPEISYTRMHRRSQDYKVYHNAWWQAFRFFAWVPPQEMCQPEDTPGSCPDLDEGQKQAGVARLEDGVTTNSNIVRAPVSNIQALTSNLRTAYLPGNTLLIDFPFMAYLNHLGHWAELMVPLLSVLLDGSWRADVRGASLVRRDGRATGDGTGVEAQGKRAAAALAAASSAPQRIDTVLLGNKMKHMTPWFSALLDLVLEAALPDSPKPRLVDYGDLAGFDQRAWLMIENLVVVQDRYTHPENKKGFAGPEHGDMWRYDHCERYVSHDFSIRFKQPEHGALLRRLAYEKLGIPAPAPWQQGTPPDLPNTISLFMPAGPEWPGITNHAELLQLLHRVAAQHNMKARMISLSEEASFGSYIDAVSRSAVLIGRHLPSMANSMFMRPGSMVVELLPYKWEWANLSMLYRNITESMGDIHHFAWRPQHYKFAYYSNISDLKYHTWTPIECHAKECLSIQARAGLIVDLEAVGQLLTQKLPAVLAGRPVEELREPWPEAV
mmetsp:Transcript_26134/g.70756  ORF Transcript_26134/g.70756 Transcript_26134/m.70756 type:complete len:546 (+) Transcript_26134:118-1755(+)